MIKQRQTAWSLARIHNVRYDPGWRLFPRRPTQARTYVADVQWRHILKDRKVTTTAVSYYTRQYHTTHEV